MGYLKSLMQDVTIATASTDSASILAKTVSRLYIGAIPASSNFDADLLFITVKIGETTLIPRISLEVMGQIWGYHEGGDSDGVSVGDHTVDTQYGIDLGNWPIPEGKRLFVELDNTDPEGVIFQVAALINTISPPFPKAYGKSTDSSFVVDNLLEMYTHDSAGDLESEANYVSVDNRRVSVEQAYVRTCAEAINDRMGATTDAVFSVNYQSVLPLDVEIQAEYVDSNPVSYYLYQVEDAEINAAVKSSMEPEAKRQLRQLSAFNRSALLTRAGKTGPVGSPRKPALR